MNINLQQRRHRMLQLLAVGNTVHSVVSAVSQEFGCSQNTVYKDYQNMDRWGKRFKQDKQMGYVLHARLELVNRTATDSMLTAKKPADKVNAANLVLKIAREQKRNENIDEAQKSSSQSMASNLSRSMPFECDPVIKQAYIDEEKKQRKGADGDVAAETEPDAGN